MKKVIAITGLGGIGIACARRLGTGNKLYLGDFNEQHLEQVSQDLSNAGHEVVPIPLDVSDRDSVESFARQATEGNGSLAAIVHTAGISPSMGTVERIVDINLVGTARMIAAFEPYLGTGTVGIFISSNSGHLSRPLSEQEIQQVLSLPPDGLKELVREWNIDGSGDAYVLTKRANQHQVMGAAARWGRKGARIVSVSPGIISTPMSSKEQENSAQMAFMIQNTPAGRIGTPEDIAATAEFLIGPGGSFISGSDLLVDGGITAFLKTMKS